MERFISDDYMYYNIRKHRYILTNEALVEEYGIDLYGVLNPEGDANPDTLPDRFLNRVSKEVYEYIYSWSSDRDATEYLISDEQYRSTIEEAMLELAYTFLMTNTDPNMLFKETSLGTIVVPPTVQTMLINNGLLFRGEIFNLPPDYKKTRGMDY